MTALAKFIHWIFLPPAEPVTALAVIRWWELRRIPYNLMLGAVGIISLLVLFECVDSSGALARGEDVIPPLAILVVPFIANLCYTAGWIVDSPMRLTQPDLPPQFTLRLFRLGLGFSLVVICLPTAVWLGYRILQVLHVMR